MRLAMFLSIVVVLLPGCATPARPAYCDPAAPAWLFVSGPQPPAIAPGNATSIRVVLHNCGTSALVVDRTPGGAGNCVLDYVVADLVRGNQTWDLARDANDAAMPPPSITIPCPPVPEANTT